MQYSEGSAARAKARRFLERLTHLTEGEIDGLAELLEGHAAEAQEVRASFPLEVLREKAKAYLEHGEERGLARGSTSPDVDDLVALLQEVRGPVDLLKLQEATAERERARLVALSGSPALTEGDLREAAKIHAQAQHAGILVGGVEKGLAAALVAFGRQVESRVRHEYEVTDGPEGSRPWRAARSNAKLREERKILQEFVVAHCPGAWVDKLRAEHPHALTPELGLQSPVDRR
jgi:hypothetical protein